MTITLELSKARDKNDHETRCLRARVRFTYLANFDCVMDGFWRGFGCGAEGKDRGGDGLVFVMMYGFEGRQKRVER